MPDETSTTPPRLDDLRQRQQSAWQRNERLLVEALVAEASPAMADSELLELIYAEVMLRAERGEDCRVAEYLQRFPQFAESLRRLFAVHEALQDSSGAPSDQARPGEPSPPRSGGSDRNLLFGILALQMDFIDRDGLVDALRDWTTQKDKPLGQILVERGDLSAARRGLLEPLVEEHVRRHDDDPAASLASISSIGEGMIDWHRVHGVDVAESLAVRRLTRHVKGADGPSGPSAGATTSSNRFRILRPHARGGIGEVFLAFDQELNREVALKEIQPRHLGEESCRERFLREAEVTGGLEHPGIVPVYSLGHHGDGRPFYAMRFIRGDSLKAAIEQFHSGAEPARINEPDDRLSQVATLIGPEAGPAHMPGPLPGGRDQPAARGQFASIEFRKLLGRFIDVCQAIEYAHSRGVLHRDLKPGNIMLGRYGETLVVDWGLAKAAGKEDRFAATDEATLIPSSSGSGIEPTQMGSAIGTPGYMSPEQAAGKLDQLGPATDVYSLGATLYHLLTGQAPITAQRVQPGAAALKLSLQQILQRIQRGEFLHPREIKPHLPQSLEAVCLKAMALRSDDRYTSSAALAEDIEHWLADEPVSAHRETVLATASRWGRKHRAWALSGTAALALVAVVSSAAAVWINAARASVVTAQQAEARQLQISLQNERLARGAQQKAEAAALGEKNAKDEESMQRRLAVAAAEAEKAQRLLAEEQGRQLQLVKSNLEVSLAESRRLLGLSFVAYGRACSLASRIANLDQSVLDASTRGAQVSEQVTLQFQLDSGLLLAAGDEPVRAAVKRFREALSQHPASPEGHEQLRALSLQLAQECGRSWRDSTRNDPMLQAAIRRGLYTQACTSADRLAHADKIEEATHFHQQFWELYWGELAIVESKEVASAMVRFGNALKPWRSGKPPAQLSELAAELRTACQLPASPSKHTE